MADFHYQYRESGRAAGDTPRWRFWLLLVLISSIIGGSLYYFWPKQEKKQENAAAGRELPKPEPKGNPAAVPEKKAVPETQEKKAETEENASPSKTVSSKEAQGKVEAAPGEKPLPDSGKGVITPADRAETDLPTIAPAPETPAETRVALEDARRALTEKRFAAAAASAEKILSTAVENSSLFREAWKILSASRMALVYSGAPESGSILYRIRTGDSLSAIAGKHGTTVEMLKKVNHLKGNRIFVGRSLKVLPAQSFRIAVQKKARLLKLYRKHDGRETLFFVADAGIGRQGKTPSAVFSISHRVCHPDWYTAEGKVIQYGSPENQLGEYFLKLDQWALSQRSGFGIHGSPDEGTVGRSLSNGCIRLKNKDVEFLYFAVPSGTAVSVEN